jgi:formylglycine-generating enzyme required for sulfatase activity
LGIAGGAQRELWIKPGSGESFRDLDIGPEMVVIPAGRFLMGSPETEPERESWQKGTESPQHEVIIPAALAVCKYAIMRGEFAAFVSATGHRTDGGAYVWTGSEWKLDPGKSWRDPGFEQTDNHPVVCLNWDDAQAYVTWLSEKTGKAYRLLSEAEWEYACRAGPDTPFWWGSSISPSQANYDGNFTYAGGGSKGEYRGKTVPVDQFQPNPWGLYQMHGNVWEWCADCWNDSYKDKPASLKATGGPWTTGGCDRRVLRGGSWSNLPQYRRSALRNWLNSSIRILDIGFRVARTL